MQAGESLVVGFKYKHPLGCVTINHFLHYITTPLFTIPLMFLISLLPCPSQP